MHGLPIVARVYVSAVVMAALVAVLLADYRGIDLAAVFLLALLFVLAESVSTLVDGGRTGISPSASAALAAVVLVGPAGAAVVGLCACLMFRRQELVKRLFNGAQFALAGFAGGHVYVLLGGSVGVPGHESFPWILAPFGAAVLVHTFVNTGLVGGLMVLLGVVRPGLTGVRWRPLATLEFSSLGYGTLGLFIAAVWGVVGLFAALLVLLPLLIARWAFEQYVAEQRARDATLATLCQAVETKDYYTRGHCMRVSRASAMIARELGMSAERVQSIGFAGLLHDVGKLGVPTKVLQKSGPLTEEEFAAIQLHPLRGCEIVREIGFLDEALGGIMHHHERMDGRGYPHGLAGEDIPEFARVIAVADAFDCMTSTRSYRRARSVEEAVTELRRCSGDQFDPVMVEALVTAVDRDGWSAVDTAEPAEGEEAEVASQDHDDPSVPLRVAGEAGR
jgi:HD superfamily phosphohydrolase YqeK